ncbi:MAG: metalloregulator ArsR/SmtB family transcription factor [Pirellulaceae bacterium]
MSNLIVDQKAASRKSHKMVDRDSEAPSPATVQSLPDNVAKELVQLFKLFSDETRMRILHFLMQQEELNVRALCELLGQSQPAVSHHLALLRVAGLIDSRRDGKHNFYRILSGRFQHLMQLMFSAGPDREGRICFENFVLSYTPVGQLEEKREEQRCESE